MAKMEQFPEPPGEMKTEETTKERAEDKTEVPAGSRSRESVPDGKTKRMPDDSLLMGRNTAKDSAKSGKGKDEKGAKRNGHPGPAPKCTNSVSIGRKGILMSMTEQITRS